ncbi:MAG: hypothetical protein [Microviridae sp.]|nr:MAG: hypothetical protein [Microviridae sp.]
MAVGYITPFPVFCFSVLVFFLLLRILFYSIAHPDPDSLFVLFVSCDNPVRCYMFFRHLLPPALHIPNVHFYPVFEAIASLFLHLYIFCFSNILVLPFLHRLVLYISPPFFSHCICFFERLHALCIFFLFLAMLVLSPGNLYALHLPYLHISLCNLLFSLLRMSVLFFLFFCLCSLSIHVRIAIYFLLFPAHLSMLLCLYAGVLYVFRLILLLPNAVGFFRIFFSIFPGSISYS